MHPHSSRILCMLRLSLILVVVAGMQFVAPVTASAQYEEEYLSYKDFYETLAPYGQWIEDKEMGYVWMPGEDINFRPYYTNGHWSMTEYGNTWISDYPWGWACFHYGRWTYDDYYGWLWIPDGNWGPAWVSWRYGDGFYGWAPLAPGHDAATSLTRYRCPDDWWVFIPPRYLYTGTYYRFWYGPRDNKHLIENSAIIVNTMEHEGTQYITGPAAAQVKQASGKAVPMFKVRNSRNRNTRIQHDEIRMFRPPHIPQVSAGGGGNPPKNVMAAPQPVRKPQAVVKNSGSVPPFRETVISRNNAGTIPGTDINRTAEPQHNQTKDVNPYEWDVSRSVKQEYTPPPKKPAPPKPAPKPVVRRKPGRSVTKPAAVGSDSASRVHKPIKVQTVTATPPAPRH